MIAINPNKMRNVQKMNQNMIYLLYRLFNFSSIRLNALAITMLFQKVAMNFSYSFSDFPFFSIPFFVRGFGGTASSREMKEKSRENEKLFKISALIEWLSPSRILRTSSASILAIPGRSVKSLAAGRSWFAHSAFPYHLLPPQLSPVSGNRRYSYDCLDGVLQIADGRRGSHGKRQPLPSGCRYDRAGTDINQVCSGVKKSARTLGKENYPISHGTFESLGLRQRALGIDKVKTLLGETPCSHRAPPKRVFGVRWGSFASPFREIFNFHLHVKYSKP